MNSRIPLTQKKVASWFRTQVVSQDSNTKTAMHIHAHNLRTTRQAIRAMMASSASMSMGRIGWSTRNTSSARKP